MKKILIISNHHSYTYNFRKEIIQKLLDDKHQVYLTLPYGESVELLEEMGCIFIESPLERRGMNPLKDYKLIRSYSKIMAEIQPDVVLSYTIKPNIYGGLVCRKLKIPFIPNVTGLGTAVSNKTILQKVLVLMYKYAFRDATCVFFQNQANKIFFVDKCIPLKKYKILPGSGINIEDFIYHDYPENNEKIKILFIGRIMEDKGIEELIKAAKVIKSEYKNIQFDALGFCEEDYKDRAQELANKDIITFHGVQKDIKKYLIECNALIHPSYHEGMSNVMLEAGAMGRPLLASNIPGCREIFDEGVSGLGFEPKDVEGLTDAIRGFIHLSHEEKKAMGIAGRQKIEKEFDREIVVDAYIKEINLIMEGK